jgi:antirestriction protein
MEDIRIYVASLSDYNDGRLEGKWFDFSDYSDGSELMEAIQEMLDELTEKYKAVDGEVREEWAVHDYEGIPSTMASEYMGEQDFQQIYDIAEVAEESNVPLEVLIERAGDTGSDDYKGLAESLMFVVDGSNEGDIVMEWEDQIGELGSDFWSNHIYIDDVTERVIYGEDVDRFRDDILSENPDMDEAEAEAEAERMADAEAEMREDLPSYLDEMGYGDTIPDFVSKDYEGAWERSMRYDYDVINHDGQMYVFSNNYSVGGTILSGMIGAYIGYKYAQSNKGKKRGHKLFAGGGGIGFKGLSAKVAKRYEGKKPEAKYRGEYGKRYSKSEAREVGDKVAGKVYWQQRGRKMAEGGMTEHGLKVGDEIMGYTKDVNELHVVNRKNNDEWHSVDLDDGKRYEGGGGVDDKVNLQVKKSDYLYLESALRKAGIQVKQRRNDTDMNMSEYMIYTFYNNQDRQRAFQYLNGLFSEGGGISGLNDLIRG